MNKITTKENLRDTILSIQDNQEELDNFNDKYDYSSITDMSDLFHSCEELKTIPHLDTSNVTDMNEMFRYCINLTIIPLLDTSKVTNMSGMFDNCSSLTSIPLLETSKVTDMNFMFLHCTLLTRIPELNTSKVTNMSGMFGDCNLETLDKESLINMINTLEKTNPKDRFKRKVRKHKLEQLTEEERKEELRK